MRSEMKSGPVLVKFEQRCVVGDKLRRDKMGGALSYVF